MVPLTSVSRPPLLLAIDGINSLFCETEYRDTESRRLRTDELSLGNELLQFFKDDIELPKTVVVGSMDSTEDSIRSPFLEQKLGLRKVPFSGVTSHDVVLPETVVPAISGPLASSELYRQINKLSSWTVYPYNVAEVESALEMYAERNFLRDASLPRDSLVGKYLAVTGGNPLKVFRYTARTSAPGTSIPPRQRNR